MEYLFGPSPNEAAAEFLKSKPIVSKEVFDQMLPEVKGRAFTIAGVEDMSVAQSIRDRLADLPQGVPWDEIKGDLVKDLHPWLDDEESGTKRAEARAELLLRTHGHQCYSATAEAVMERQRDVFPFSQYKTMEDMRVRPTHAALDGVVLPAGHEFWATHTPPWDWGCRCLKIPLSQEDRDDAAEEDEGKSEDDRDVLSEGAARELSATRRIARNGVTYNVTAPAETGKPGAFSWRPGSLRIPIEEMRRQYALKPGGAETFASFEKMAKGTVLGGDVTLWEWLKGAELPARSFVPVAAPAEKQMTLPLNPPAAKPGPGPEPGTHGHPPKLAGAIHPLFDSGDRDEWKAWADGHMHPDGLGLSAEERGALEDYQAEGYELINASLRGIDTGAEAIHAPGEVLAPGENPAWLTERISMIESAIRKSRLPRALTLYRGVRTVDVAGMKVGELTMDPAFRSTSLAYSAADIFQEGAMMTIEAPAGTEAMYMDELADGYGHEVEILLQRGSKLRIVKKERRDGVWYIDARLEP